MPERRGNRLSNLKATVVDQGRRIVASIRDKNIAPELASEPISESAAGIAVTIASHISDVSRFSFIGVDDNRSADGQPNQGDVYAEPSDRASLDSNIYPKPDMVLTLAGKNYGQIARANQDNFYARIGFFIRPEETLVQLVPFEWEGAALRHEYKAKRNTIDELFGLLHDASLSGLRRINLFTIKPNGEVVVHRPHNERPFGCDLVGLSSKLQSLEPDERPTSVQVVPSLREFLW